MPNPVESRHQAQAREIAEHVAAHVSLWGPAKVAMVESLILAALSEAHAKGVEETKDAKRKAVANCYMMAKREIARIRNGKAQFDATGLERWEHVLRFCEESGEKSSILRDGLPTEITDGADTHATGER